MEKRKITLSGNADFAGAVLNQFGRGSAVVATPQKKYRLLLEFDSLEDSGLLWCLSADDGEALRGTNMSIPTRIRCANSQENHYAIMQGELDLCRYDPIQSNFRKRPVYLIRIRLHEMSLMEKTIWNRISTGMRNLVSFRWSDSGRTVGRRA